MSTTTDNPIRNDVDRTALFATIDAVKGGPELAAEMVSALGGALGGSRTPNLLIRRPISASSPSIAEVPRSAI